MHDLDLNPLLAYLATHVASYGSSENRFTDVRFVSHFTDASKIVRRAHVVADWERVNFEGVSWREWHSWVYGKWQLRLPPVSSHRAVIDRMSLGGEGGLPFSRRTVLFAPSRNWFAML